MGRGNTCADSGAAARAAREAAAGQPGWASCPWDAGPVTHSDVSRCTQTAQGATVWSVSQVGMRACAQAVSTA